MRGRWLVVAGVIAVAGALAGRQAVVASWGASFGDSVQYHQLAQQLRWSGRFAYGPAPSPPTRSRLPGFPLWIAAVVEPHARVDLETHTRLVTRWNALLDVLTALLVFLLARERGLGRAAGWAFAAVVACPLLLFLSTHGLTESLATFLATFELFLVVRAMRSRVILHAALAGAVAGFAQLVRVDAVAMLPPALLALAWATGSWRRRVAAIGSFAVAAGVVFAPWPIRNQLRFGAPHPEAAAWLDLRGNPLPLGMMRWMRTWATGIPGEGFIPFAVAADLPLDVKRPGIVLAPMYDDAAERARVVALFERYNRKRLAPDVDGAFVELARERERRAPLRTFVWLPLRRIANEWKPIPEYELPVRAGILGLPRYRFRWAVFEWVLFALALVGAAVLYRTRRVDGSRRTFSILFVTVAARSAVPALTHPCPVERYLAEAFPALLVFTGVGLASLEAVVHRSLRRILTRP